MYQKYQLLQHLLYAPILVSPTFADTKPICGCTIDILLTLN